MKISKNVWETIKSPVVAPIIALLLFFFIIIIVYGIAKTDTYINTFKVIAPEGSGIGSIGDFFNGLVAPSISIISIVYIYKAFQQQYQANQMLNNFEIMRSFKEDLEWLRNNSIEIQELEKLITKMDDDELENFLDSPENYKLRKANYIILTFEKLYLNAKELKNSNIQNEISTILYSLYLPSLKNIFRKFNNYINSRLSESDDEIDYSLLEIEYLKRFLFLYNHIKENYPDNLFDITYASVYSKIIK